MKKTYHQPREIKLVAWLYLALSTPAILIFLVELSRGRVENPSSYIFIPLLFLPFYIGACWILWHFRGEFILTNEGIMLKQFGRQTFLRFQDIFSIEERGSQFLPYLLLVSSDASLTISFKVNNFTDLYANLRKNISVMQIAEREKLPLVLHFRPGYVRQTLIGFSAYALFTGVLSTGFAHNKPWSVWSMLGGWSIFLVIAFFVFWINELTSPYRVIVDGEQIEARYLFSKTKVFTSGTILKIERERQVRRIRFGVTMVVHPIVITFQSGERLQLEEARIWSFGYSPDRLLIILKRQFSET